MTDVEIAVSIVTEAGGLARQMRERGVEAAQKTSISDIVTEADRAAEELVVRRLRAARPDDSIVGEEGTDHRGSSGRTWIIDPVDGTYNYAAGLDRWCSALALVEGESRVLGAIRDAVGAATYAGGPDVPATRNGEPLVTPPDVPLAEACVATYLHPPFLGTPVAAAWERAVSGGAAVRMLGSGSLDLVSVALGQFDVFVQHSVPPWDWHPGAALVEAVGRATAKVTAGGVEWSVAGAPAAVAEVCDRLQDG